MKAVYFLIGVALFIACAVVFLNEHEKSYEFFDGTAGAGAGSPPAGATAGTPPAGSTPPAGPPNTVTTDSSGNTMDSSGNTVNTGTAAGAGTGGAPGTTTSNTTATNPNSSPQTPGSTTANPTVGTPSQNDLQVYIDSVVIFSMGVSALGGKNAVLNKLSPDDISYFNTLYLEVSKITQYAMAPATFPYNSAQTANKTKEYTYANQYLVSKIPNLTAGSSAMRIYVQDKISGVTSGSAGSAAGSAGGSAAGSAGSAGGSAGGSSGSGVTGNTTTATAYPGGQGNQPLSGQFMMNGNPMSDYVQATGNGAGFAPGKKDTDMVDPSDLQSLITSVKTITEQLKSLNTTEPVIVARIQNIDRLLLDLNEIKQSLQQGKTSPDQIPIRVGDARNFLKQSNKLEQQLPNLISMPAVPDAGASTPAMTQTSPQNLLEMAKYLKGSISLHFDGDLYAREQMAKRVDKITNMLETKKISSRDAENILQALTAIQGQLGPSNYEQMDVFKSKWSPTGGMPSESTPGYLPDQEQLKRASDGGFTSSLRDRGDDNIRPGTGSNSYLKRASSAYSAYAFNDSTAPDYKDKLVNLCANVTKSGLDMGNIGCTNIGNVGPDYGYKGAYLMICNRLEDTWGGSYPQMFGCPTKN
jgi:hypothetical protein